ncbi:MAG: TIGR03617 family F420-dependent LLM class oxidoreductase [Dehalococcoidia bacterium]|nr:TIGR03617 family F420-dependent LLM class oxidoreductase [Dehalococcoidia bacterium]MCA9843591.1 TIGR03617 family F420-dependent LLM class oxidoreductase [Dehalococcoidia bacterium]
MKVGTGFGGGWLARVPEQAQQAEALGYDFASTPETSHDSMLAATLAAANTSKLEVQTSVTIAFPRSPTVLAMEAWDIQHMSEGRFAIGLGSQVKGHNQHRFSVDWPGAPATRMKEYIRMMRAVWHSFRTGEKPDYAGRFYHFTLMTPNFNPGPIDYPDPKIGLALVGDAMARVAGEVADIVMPHGFMTDKYMREVVLPNVAIGLKRGNRTWSDIEITGGGFTVFAETESEIEQGLERLRQPISFYGSTRSYHEVFEVHELKSLGMQLHELSLQGKWGEMAKAIPEAVLRTFAQTSTYDKLPEFIAQKREYASKIGLALPAGTPAERERAQHIIKESQKVEVTGIPRGLEDLSKVQA